MTMNTIPEQGIALHGDLVAVERFEDWPPMAGDAYRRLADAFDALEPEEWELPTPCEGWTVRDMGGHLVGAMRAAARLREMMSQQRQISSRVKRTGENMTDVMTSVQIERTAELAMDEIVAQMRALVESAVRGRARVPSFLRHRVKFAVEIGSISEPWTLEYLNGCILTRDAWLHRIDLWDAVGAAPALDDVDRRMWATLPSSGPAATVGRSPSLSPAPPAAPWWPAPGDPTSRPMPSSSAWGDLNPG